MKVLGTGAPEVLTVRFERSELPALVDQLHRRRACVLDAGATPLASQLGWRDRRDDEEDRCQELIAISRVLEQIEPAPAHAEPALEVIGPTWLLAPVLRAAAAAALERLTNALHPFSGGTAGASPARLRAESDAASAAIETLLAYHHVDNHGLDG